MVSDPVLYGSICLGSGLLGLVRPQAALVLYRVTRGRSAAPDASSTTWVRIVAGFLAAVGLAQLGGVWV
ncbi:MAG: hypothetical protein ACOCSD_04880 [Halolamina sp.]